MYLILLSASMTANLASGCRLGAGFLIRARRFIGLRKFCPARFHTLTLWPDNVAELGVWTVLQALNSSASESGAGSPSVHSMTNVPELI